VGLLPVLDAVAPAGVADRSRLLRAWQEIPPPIRLQQPSGAHRELAVVVRGSGVVGSAGKQQLGGVSPPSKGGLQGFRDIGTGSSALTLANGA
jgi:hypothetical protein